VVMHPVDTVKVRKQALGAALSESAGAAAFVVGSETCMEIPTC